MHATAIKEGERNAGQLPPSERLVEQGLVHRRRGAGNGLTATTGAAQSERHRAGMPGRSRWLLRGFTPAAPDEQRSLELKSGERVARLEQLRLQDAAAVAYEVSVLPRPVLPDPRKVSRSLYAHLGTRAPVHVRQHVRAVIADARIAGLLGLAAGTAVLFVTRMGYQPCGRPVELTYTYCRSDCFDFVAEMRRD